MEFLERSGLKGRGSGSGGAIFFGSLHGADGPESVAALLDEGVERAVVVGGEEFTVAHVS
jgi:hypothetical protein